MKSSCFPAHGAGSACGKNISQERSSTIGLQKKLNYALQARSKDDFIAQVTTGILPPPQYFAKNAALNKMGYNDLDELLETRTRPMSVAEVEQAQADGALILDTRHQLEFGEGFIPGSWFIGMDGSFASWVGTLIENLDQPIVLITASGREREGILRLARVGYTNALGYLAGGFDAWARAGKPIESISSIKADEFETIYHSEHPHVLDVRKPTEFEVEHVKDASLFPLDYINAHLEDHNKESTYYLHCRSGFRSMIAASIMKSVGYERLINIDGGIIDISATSVPREETACASSQ